MLLINLIATGFNWWIQREKKVESDGDDLGSCVPAFDPLHACDFDDLGLSMLQWTMGNSPFCLSSLILFLSLKFHFLCCIVACTINITDRLICLKLYYILISFPLCFPIMGMQQKVDHVHSVQTSETNFKCDWLCFPILFDF